MQDGTYAFGDFSLLPAERRLFQAGRDVVLPPKAFDALLLLVRHHGTLVSRDEIIRTLWPNIHVAEANLTNIIVLLRTLPGKEAIQTVSKYGYRFAAKPPPGDNLAHAAFRRAFLIDPDLACAHQFYTQYQVDTSQTEMAMIRLGGRLKRRGEDPETLTGLVQVLRFCGLLDESIAAHERAVCLDPTTQTSVAHTWFLKGEYAKVFETYTGFRLYLDAAAWAGLGDTQHAAALLRSRLAKNEMSPLMAGPGASLLAALEGRRDDVLAILESIRSFNEPEAQFYLARHSAMVGAVEPTLGLLQRARAGGFIGLACLQKDRVFDCMRELPQFQEELQICLHMSQQAARKYHEESWQGLGGGQRATQEL